MYNIISTYLCTDVYMHHMYITHFYLASLSSLSDKFEPFLRSENIEFDGPRFSMGLVEKHIAEAAKWRNCLWAIVFALAQCPKLGLLWIFVVFSISRPFYQDFTRDLSELTCQIRQQPFWGIWSRVLQTVTAFKLPVPRPKGWFIGCLKMVDITYITDTVRGSEGRCK